MLRSQQDTVIKMNQIEGPQITDTKIGMVRTGTTDMDRIEGLLVEILLVVTGADIII